MLIEIYKYILNKDLSPFEFVMFEIMKITMSISLFEDVEDSLEYRLYHDPFIVLIENTLTLEITTLKDI